MITQPAPDLSDLNIIKAVLFENPRGHASASYVFMCFDPALAFIRVSNHHLGYKAENDCR